MNQVPQLKRAFAAISLVASFFALEQSAQAATGYVSGRWLFLNMNGNYCPSNNDCVGARYVQTQYNTNLPIANAKVQVRTAADTVIGNGVTDANGSYSVSWTASVRPTQIKIVIYPSHGANRFYFANAAGQLVNNATPAITTASTSSSASPQAMGTWIAGSATTPEPYYNAYWAAEHLWRDVLGLVGSATTNFTNIQIRGFADTMPGYINTSGDCVTSCAWGPTKEVHLDADAALTPAARTMHELGHIFSYVSHPWKIDGAIDYTWSSTATPGANSWNFATPEWGSVAFEEAFATHPGSIALWWDNAVTPTTCNTAGTCYSSTGVPAANTNIEASSFPSTTNNCVTTTTNPESRRPISAMRFLWDVFDNRNDTTGDDYSANQGDYWRHLALLAFYAEGTGANQIDEVWNTDKTAATEKDGRGSTSYKNNYATNIRSVAALWQRNCSPR